MGRRLVTAVIVAIATITAMVTGSAAQAATGLIFPVMNTSEQPPDGVWFRNSPHTADTDRITGLGVYMNEQVQASCYAWGDAVGRYGNQIWYKASNVTRPIVAGRSNEGWINTHYVSDGQTANHPAPGVPACGGPPPPPPPASTGSHVTYYSGVGTAGAQTARNLGVARVLTDNGSFDGPWHSNTKCAPNASAVNFAGKDITRLAGWSLGRLGPIYALKYLKDHNGTEAARHINYVVLFDPGAPADFGSCDYNHPNVRADQTLAWWLSLSTDNRLVIMSGNDTAVNRHQTIQNAYFPAIKAAGTAVRQRVLVCNYTLNHEDTYNRNAGVMTNDARISTLQGLNSCPRQGTQQVWGWNP